MVAQRSERPLSVNDGAVVRRQFGFRYCFHNGMFSRFEQRNKGLSSDKAPSLGAEFRSSRRQTMGDSIFSSQRGPRAGNCAGPDSFPDLLLAFRSKERTFSP